MDSSEKDNERNSEVPRCKFIGFSYMPIDFNVSKASTTMLYGLLRE